MPVTYKKIASVTVGAGGASNITFSSIPATYTDLVLFLSARDAGTGTNTQFRVEYNGSSTAVYSDRQLAGNGSSASSYSRSGSSAMLNTSIPSSGATANTFSNTTVYIPNYAGSTNKSASVDGVAETNATAVDMELSAWLWANTAAINQIKITLQSGANLVQYSTATLYGISKS